jgi:hypothetical protein
MPFTVDITPSGKDGLSVTLTADELTCSIFASYIPYDSLSELSSSLIAMLQSSGTSSSRWSTEPIEYEIILEAIDKDGEVQVWRYQDARRQREEGQRVFTYNAELLPIVRAFWRTFRRLESDTAFVSQWPHPFPHRDIQRLRELLTHRR